VSTVYLKTLWYFVMVISDDQSLADYVLSHPFEIEREDITFDTTVQNSLLEMIERCSRILSVPTDVTKKFLEIPDRVYSFVKAYMRQSACLSGLDDFCWNAVYRIILFNIVSLRMGNSGIFVNLWMKQVQFVLVGEYRSVYNKIQAYCSQSVKMTLNDLVTSLPREGYLWSLREILRPILQQSEYVSHDMGLHETVVAIEESVKRILMESAITICLDHKNKNEASMETVVYCVLSYWFVHDIMVRSKWGKSVLVPTGPDGECSYEKTGEYAYGKPFHKYGIPSITEKIREAIVSYRSQASQPQFTKSQRQTPDSHQT